MFQSGSDGFTAKDKLSCENLMPSDNVRSPIPSFEQLVEVLQACTTHPFTKVQPKLLSLWVRAPFSLSQGRAQIFNLSVFLIRLSTADFSVFSSTFKLLHFSISLTIHVTNLCCLLNSTFKIWLWLLSSSVYRSAPHASTWLAWISRCCFVQLQNFSWCEHSTLNWDETS